MGISGERSGLWSEYARLIGELRPRYVIVENVAALLGRGMGRVLGDLAEIGYDAEWETIPACHFGLPHLRERVWILAYPNKQRLETQPFERILLPKTHCEWRIGHIISVGGKEVFRSSPNGGTMVAESILVGSRNGIPHRAHRIKGIGNAIVPQIAEWIGRRILESDFFTSDSGKKV
jgi:DNA (cytosine-5)-methyltransferase 1